MLSLRNLIFAMKTKQLILGSAFLRYFDEKVFIQCLAIDGVAEKTKLNNFKYFNFHKEAYY